MDRELIEFLDRRFNQFKNELRAELRTEIRAEIAASGEETRRYVDVVAASAEATRHHVDASAEETRRHIDATATETRRHFSVVAGHLMGKIQFVGEGVLGVDQKVDRRRVDQDLRECLDRCLDELRMAIRDETARTCQHIDAFGERLKPGRFLRYLEARAGEIADRGTSAGGEPGLGPAQRSVVYAVPRVDQGEAGRKRSVSTTR